MTYVGLAYSGRLPHEHFIPRPVVCSSKRLTAVASRHNPYHVTDSGLRVDGTKGGLYGPPSILGCQCHLITVVSE